MMKKCCFSFFLIISSSLVFAQWVTNGADISNTNTGNVGIGIPTPLVKLHINGAIRGNSDGGALTISTASGTVEIGPMNSGFSHFLTNMTKYYFNKPVYVDGAVSSYNTLNLDLQTNGITRMSVLNSNGYVGIGNPNPLGNLQVNPIRPIIIKYNGGNGVYGSEIGFNALLQTSVVPNKFKKLGGTNQKGGAAIVVDYYGNMFFQTYAGIDETESIVDYKPQFTFTNAGDVGIGTNPSSKFDISGVSGTMNKIHISNAAVGSDGYFDINMGTTDSYASGMRAYVPSNQPGIDRVFLGFYTTTYDAGLKSRIERLTITDRGLVGIGTSNPLTKLEVGNGTFSMYGTGLSGDTYQRFVLYADVTNGLYFDAPKKADGTKSNIEFNWRGGGTPPLFVSGANDFVGIGTNSPDAKLTVKGHIHTQEVRVDLTGAVAPDYVFAKDYELVSLEDVEKYVTENKHLPEVPSAIEMEQNGINLKEMNLLLLKKVEELTLYLIEANKNITGLQKELKQLKKK